MMTIRSGLCAAGLAAIWLAGPAVAQSALCGGLGDGAPWMGGTEAASDIATAPQPLAWSGAVAEGTRAVARFTLGAPMAVRVEAAADDLAGDPVVELFDAEGRLVVIDDDAGGGRSARAEPELAQGTYCVAMMGFGGIAVEGRLQVSRLGMPALTPGLAGGFAGMEDAVPFVGIDPCLPQTPAKVLGGGLFDPGLAGGLSATGNGDQASYFRFTLASPQSLSIRASNQMADPYLYLFDAEGRLLAENDDADGLDSRIDFVQPLGAGSYCIGLRALGDATLPIAVSVTGEDARAAAIAGYAAGEIVPPLDGSWPLEDLGVLPPRLEADRQVSGNSAQWFTLEMPRAGLLFITAQEISNSDPVVSLFDGTGQLLGSNDDAFETTDSELALELEAGRYVLAVRQFDSGYGGMIRVGLTRYELAAP